MRGALPDIGKMLRSQGSDAYLADMNFLTRDIWPIAQKSLIQHDAFSCERYGGGLPIPHVRKGGEHLGGVYVNNVLRSMDVAILLEVQRPQKCTPPEEYAALSPAGVDKAASAANTPSLPVVTPVATSSLVTTTPSQPVANLSPIQSMLHSVMPSLVAAPSQPVLVPPAQSMEEVKVECISMGKVHSVVPGDSWGSLPKEQIGRWNALDCDTVYLWLPPQGIYILTVHCGYLLEVCIN